MTSIEINAAILEKDLSEIESKLNSSKGLVDVAQIDICDGTYVPSTTFMSEGSNTSTEQLASITKETTLELDMMIDWQSMDASQLAHWITALTKINPSRIVLHNTSITDVQIEVLLNTLDPTKVEFGLGIHLDDSLDEVVARFDMFPFTYVQIMGIEKVGYGGQNQSNKLIPYIQAFHALRPDVPISVDGGVKLENVQALKKAGATRMTIGSGLFKTEDIEKRAEDLRAELV